MGPRLAPTALLLLALLAGCAPGALFFHPVKEYAARPDPSVCAVEEVSFASADGKRLTGWLLSPRDGPPRATVLFLHGNFGNVSLMLFPVEPLVAAGLRVLTFDYQGYGRSEGEPSREGVLGDAQAALDALHTHPDSAGLPLLVFGQSLGGHVAVALAARNPGRIDALAIEGAFTGFEDIAEWTARSRGAPRALSRGLGPRTYRALEAIVDVRVPLLVIHSVDDEYVPFFMGEALFARAGGPKTFWAVRGRHLRAAEVDPAGFAARFLELARQAGATR